MSTLARPSLVVLLATLASRASGYARDLALVAAYGAGGRLDLLLLAFRVPEFVRRVGVQGALQPAYVSRFAAVTARGDPGTSARMLGAALAGVGGPIMVVSLLAIPLAPVLLRLLLPDEGGNAALLDEGAAALRWTLPMAGLAAALAIVGGTLQVRGRFALPALTPMLMNLAIIAAVLVGHPRLSGIAAWALAALGAALAWQFALLASQGLRPALPDHWLETRRIWVAMGPMLLGSLAPQLAQLLAIAVAGGFSAGAVTWLYCAERLMELPHGLIGASLAVVALPRLALQHASDAPAAFSATLDWALRVALLLALPTTAAAWALAEPATITLFQYGAFDASDSRMTAAALQAYSLGLPALCLTPLLLSACFARHQLSIPAMAGGGALAAGACAAALLLGTNLGDALPPHVRLAACVSFTLTLNALGLLLGLRRSGYRSAAHWSPTLLRLLVTCSILAAVLGWLKGDPAAWMAMTAGARFLKMGLLAACALLSYAAVLWLLRFDLRSLREPAS